jgi:hypothetical protein
MFIPNCSRSESYPPDKVRDFEEQLSVMASKNPETEAKDEFVEFRKSTPAFSTHPSLNSGRNGAVSDSHLG